MMTNESDNVKLIPGGIAIALMAQRKELRALAMRGLRTQAAAGMLIDEPLEHVLNALEGLCERVIEDGLARRGFDEAEDDAEWKE
jgi:hypothetical protein